jgi:epsilon-lactone hydrolase
VSSFDRLKAEVRRRWPRRARPGEDDGPVGVGAGALSAEARRRLAKRDPVPLSPPPIEDLDAVAAWRHATNAAWLAGDPLPSEEGHSVADVGGVRCLRTAEPESVGTIVYLHGGGYVLGSPEVAVPITARLAGELDVVSVDYRLAPEHPYPAGLEDALAVYRAVREERPELPVAVAGESAGAGLAVALAVRLLAAGEPRPDALALFSPHLDHGPRPKRRRRAAGEDVDASAAEWLAAAYCGTTDRRDPGVSPLRAHLGGLPPVLVQVGGAESLLEQSIRFARRARQAGVDVTLDVWDGLWHAWHYHRRLPEADQALLEARLFLLHTVLAYHRAE